MEYKKLLSENEIDTIVDSLAFYLSRDYLDETNQYLFVNVLDGGTPFFNLLYDKLDNTRFKLIPDSVKCKSYTGVNTTGWKLIQPIHNTDETIKKVIIVDDILDSGLTLYNLTDYFMELGFNEIICVTLLEKDVLNKTYHPVPKYISGHYIDDIWVCGFGMDSIDGTRRDAREIYQILMLI